MAAGLSTTLWQFALAHGLLIAVGGAAGFGPIAYGNGNLPGGAGNLAGAMVNATPFLELMGIVMLAVESLEQAIVAKAVIERDGENAHLAGKLLNVRFYVRNILPKATAISKSIQGDDYACLDERLFA